MAVVAGAIIYRLILGLALRIGILDTGDMKLITAVIVILALIIPQFFEKRREKKRKAKRYADRMAAMNKSLGKGENSIAQTGTD